MIAETAAPRRRFATWVYVRGDEADVEEYLGQYHLNAAATSVWLACDGTQSVVQIGEALARRYGIPTEDALADTAEFVEELIAANVVELVHD